MKHFKTIILIIVLLSTCFCQGPQTAFRNKNITEYRNLELRDSLRHRGRNRHTRERRLARHKDRTDKWAKYLKRR